MSSTIDYLLRRLSPHEMVVSFDKYTNQQQVVIKLNSYVAIEGFGDTLESAVLKAFLNSRFNIFSSTVPAPGDKIYTVEATITQEFNTVHKPVPSLLFNFTQQFVAKNDNDAQFKAETALTDVPGYTVENIKTQFVKQLEYTQTTGR